MEVLEEEPVVVRHLNKIRNNKYVIAVTACVLLVGIFLFNAALLKYGDNPKIATPSATGIQLWSGVIVGKTTIYQAKNQFGNEIFTKVLADNLKLTRYQGSKEGYPVQVITNSNGTIVLLDIANSEYKKEKSQFVAQNNLGQSDFELFKKVNSNYDQRLEVFLSKGIALFGNKYGNNIFNYILFAPADKDTIKKLLDYEYGEENEIVPNVF